MDDNTAKAIILGVLFGGIALTVIAAIWTSAWRDRAKQKGSDGLSMMEWANRLHDLAQVFKDAEGPDQQTAGRVLMDHAHLLRAGHPNCGCKPVPRVENAGEF